MAAKKEAVKQEENVKPTPVPFTVGFNRSQSESIVYGSLILGILFAVIGIVGNLPLLALAALAPLAIAFWHYPMIEKGKPQLGANEDGLYVERIGFIDWAAAADFAKKIIADYDVKCPSENARVRLLSGGNMQKLILGRALDGDPDVILASQPTRGLDIGAVTYVHRKLIEARDRGAAILLISEDLDEIQSLSDRIVVMSEGRLSAPSLRGERSQRELGILMAGHGMQQGLDAGSDTHAA